MSVKLFSFMLFFLFSTGFVYCPPGDAAGVVDGGTAVVSTGDGDLRIQVIVSDPARLRELGGLRLTLGQGLDTELPLAFERKSREMPIAERLEPEQIEVVWYETMLSVVRRDGRDALGWTLKGTFISVAVLAVVDVWFNNGTRTEQAIKLLGETKAIRKVAMIAGLLVSLNEIVNGFGLRGRRASRHRGYSLYGSDDE